MESKITRYSAAAVVVLSITLVLLSPFGPSNNGGIVWAEVAQKVGEAQTVTHRMKRVFWKLGEDEPFLEADVMKYVSLDLGLVEEQYNEDGHLMHRAYFLKEQQQFIMVFPATKKYIKISIPEDFFSQLTKLISPQGLIDYITAGQYTELGRTHFDGFEVYGFETNDIDLSQVPEQLLFIIPVNDITGRLWIDVETSLPVGIEMELTTDRGMLTGFQRLRAKFRAYDIQWNADIPEGTFEPNIPDDYREIKLSDLIPVKAGIAGLGIIPAGFVVWKRLRRKKRINARDVGLNSINVTS